MKKRHPMKTLVIILVAILLCTAAAVSAFFGIKGYGMYRDAIARTPLEERVDAIREDEQFTHYSELPDFYIDAVISVEDHRFEDHCGIDPIAICRALWTDLKTMSFREGGSTITQQLAKNLLFEQDKTLERKAAEVFAAFAIEEKYSKAEIFELYVNTVYFGSGYYGIYAAAKGYFGKQPTELTDYEAAVLAGVPNAPPVYSPDANPELAAQRAAQVLHCMVRNKLLTQEEAEKIQDDGLTQVFGKRDIPLAAACGILDIKKSAEVCAIPGGRISEIYFNAKRTALSYVNI